MAIEYPSAPQENITYTYDEGADALGRLTAIDDPSGETTLSYDDRGNLIRDERTIDGVNYMTRYEYNLAGQMTAMIYPSGRVARVTTQASGASPVRVVAEDLDYLPYGPASGWTHGNGLEPISTTTRTTESRMSMSIRTFLCDV
ncbi:MAG: RHS repeat domain-containing protein [Gammaproteobacteria bacterium]|nr:RHS repeat domain-containing protein [Gammaproteobacteria bacterium]